MNGQCLTGQPKWGINPSLQPCSAPNQAWDVKYNNLAVDKSFQLYLSNSNNCPWDGNDNLNFIAIQSGKSMIISFAKASSYCLSFNSTGNNFIKANCDMGDATQKFDANGINAMQSTPTVQPSAAPLNSTSSSNPINIGIIIGIVVALLVVCAIIYTIFAVKRKQSKSNPPDSLIPKETFSYQSVQSASTQPFTRQDGNIQSFQEHLDGFSPKTQSTRISAFNEREPTIVEIDSELPILKDNGNAFTRSTIKSVSEQPPIFPTLTPPENYHLSSRASLRSVLEQPPILNDSSSYRLSVRETVGKVSEQPPMLNFSNT
ncbi:hypothetical protein HDV06_001499 [Boothiomyces sp. JEL0866]|nr:hypothetical protein HDV06_001499 [Boothiomyces sp. JEL0866]